MLSDEEKKAIEWLKKADWFSARLYAPTILNLIEKQSKEIEELNKSDASKEQSSMNYYNLYKELVDKIKAKIEELNKDFKEYENGQEWEIQDEIRGQIEVLRSLLEKE